MAKKSTVTPFDLVAKPKHKSVKHKGKPKSWSGVVKRAEDGKKTPNAQIVDNQQAAYRGARKKYTSKYPKKVRSSGAYHRMKPDQLRALINLLREGRALHLAYKDRADDFMRRLGAPVDVKRMPSGDRRPTWHMETNAGKRPLKSPPEYRMPRKQHGYGEDDRA